MATAAGSLFGAVQQWGDQHLPRPEGPTVVRQSRRTGRPLHVGYIDDRGRQVDLDDVAMVRTAAYPT